MLSVVAPDVAQLSVLIPPSVMLVGLAVNELIVGKLGWVTVTVTVAVAVPVVFVAVSVYVVVAAGLKNHRSARRCGRKGPRRNSDACRSRSRPIQRGACARDDGHGARGKCGDRRRSNFFGGWERLRAARQPDEGWQKKERADQRSRILYPCGRLTVMRDANGGSTCAAFPSMIRLPAAHSESSATRLSRQFEDVQPWGESVQLQYPLALDQPIHADHRRPIRGPCWVLCPVSPQCAKNLLLGT